MFFSPSTLAILAPLLLTAVVATPIEERSTSLCNQANYGASGVPWKSSSSPGAFCGSSKPSNSKQWKSLPLWDGGDTVKCSDRTQKKNLKVCNGGNSKASLPKNCNPPHKHGRGNTSTSTAKSSTTTTKASTSTSSAPGTTSSAAQSVASSAAVSSSSAAASVDPAASSVASSAAASSATDAAASSTTSSDTSAATSIADSTSTVVDPLSDPVCELTYQVTYQNYTVVAPNGYWYGQTVGAAAQDASYLTYTLATSVDDCLAACDQIEGCKFVNSYIDENDTETDLPKHTPGVLTCAMFSSCVPTTNNNNWGGQDDPNIIVNSNGYCKSGACS